jgi:hypothetical protein
MKRALAVAGAILLSVATPAFAHRVDEYLQATIISVDKDRARAEVHLTPGIEVFSAVLALIDTDKDGALSESEQRKYAERVGRDLSLAIDDRRLRLTLDSTTFPSVAAMREGRGVIELVFAADVPRGVGDRRLVFENRHLSQMSAYLVNGLVPRDAAIRFGTQTRNYEQSLYQLSYVQAGGDSGMRLLTWVPVDGRLLAAALLSLAAWVGVLRQRRTRTSTAR